MPRNAELEMEQLFEARAQLEAEMARMGIRTFAHMYAHHVVTGEERQRRMRQAERIDGLAKGTPPANAPEWPFDNWGVSHLGADDGPDQ